MSYNKRTQATGNVVGAVDLNRIENGIADIDVDEIRGWGVQTTQLFSESVTTADNGSGMNVGVLVYSGTIDSASIVVTFNGTDYTCPRIDAFGEYFYGGFTQSGPDFSEYPFAIDSGSQGNALYTQTAGTYTVAVSASGIAVSDNFSNAVNQCVDTSLMPMQCTSGVSTETEMTSAQQGGKILYFKYQGTTYIITAMANGSVGFIPENSSIVVAFISGVFDIGEV